MLHIKFGFDLAKWIQRRRSLKLWTDGRTDDGRMSDHGHPISSPCEPNGSGELKTDISEHNQLADFKLKAQLLTIMRCAGSTEHSIGLLSCGSTSQSTDHNHLVGIGQHFLGLKSFLF